MENKRFINGLKNGGIKIVIIYFILRVSIDLIGCILSGKNIISAIVSNTNDNIPLNSGTSGKLVVYTTILMVMYLIINAGLFGSSNDIIEGKPTSFSTFLHNSKRYFLRTLGYTLLYTLVVGIVMLILFILSTFVSSNSSLSNALSNAVSSSSSSLSNSLSISNIPAIVNFVATFIFQAIFIPLIILNVIDKDTKGYIKKNYVTILIFSLIACLLDLIPIAGQFFYLILDCVYPLLIISMCDRVEATEYNKITMQDINNNDLL